MSGFHGASIHIKFSLGLMLLTGLGIIVAYSVPYWITRPDGYAGLWTACTNGNCYERWNQWIPDWQRAVQFMMTSAIVTWTMSIGCLFAFVFHRYFDDDHRMVALSLLFTTITGKCLLLSVLTWACGQTYTGVEVLNWGFVLAVVCTVMSFATAALLVIDLRVTRKQYLYEKSALQAEYDM